MNVYAKGQGDALFTALICDDLGGITLTYQQDDIETLTGRKTPHTKTFRLPLHPTNDALFGLWFDARVIECSWDARKSVECYLMRDGQVLIEGRLLLLSVDETGYEVQAVGAGGALYSRIKGLRLRDLDWGELTHDLTAQNIKDSQDLDNDITLSGGAGTVIYPLADYGREDEDYRTVFYVDNEATTDGIALPQYMKSYHYKPAVKMDFIFRKILQYAGFSLAESGTFMDTPEWTRLYMTAVNHRPYPTTAAELGASTTINAGGNTPYNDVDLTLLNMTDSSGTNALGLTLFDYGGNVGDSGYIIPSSGYYSGNLLYAAACPNAVGTGSAIIYVQVACGNQSFTQSLGLPSGGATMVGSIDYDFDASFGDVIQVSIITTGNVQVLNQQWRLLVNNRSFGGGTILTNDLFGDESCEDIVRDIIRRFNLVPELNANGQMTFNTWTDYAFTGATKNWSNKVDRSHPIVSKPPKVAKKLTFTEADDTTIDNEYYQSEGQAFGTFVQDMDIDSATGDETHTGFFAPFAVVSCPGLGTAASEIPRYTLHRSTDRDGKRLQSYTPKLFYHAGLKNLGSGKAIYVEDVEFVEFASCGQLAKRPTGFPTFSPGVGSTASLQWDYDEPATPYSLYESAPSNETLVARYWSKHLMQKYSEDARQVTLRVKLSANDIQDFDFRDIVVIDSVEYQLLKIEDWNPVGEGSCKVSLLRRVYAVQSTVIGRFGTCTSEASRINDSGELEFFIGGVWTTSEVCCTEAGGTWDGTRCLIYPRQQPDSSGVASPVSGNALGDSQIQNVMYEQLTYFPTSGGATRLIMFAFVPARGSVYCTPKGDGVNHGIYMPVYGSVWISAEVLTQTIDAGGNYGDIQGWTFKGVASSARGTVSYSNFGNHHALGDSAPNRNIRLISKGGKSDYAGAVLGLACEHQENEVVMFTLEVTIVVSDHTPYSEYWYSLRTEDDGFDISTEVGHVIVQE